MVPFLEETIEVPMRVRSSSSLSGLRTVDLFPVFPGVFAPGLSWLPLTGFDFAGLVDGLFLSLRSRNPHSRSDPFSHFVTFWSLCEACGVHPCSLAHYGAPWLVAWRPCHCLITTGLATVDGTQLASSDESQLCGRPSRGGTAPVDWLRGVFPCFDHLPSF